MNWWKDNAIRVITAAVTILTIVSGVIFWAATARSKVDALEAELLRHEAKITEVEQAQHLSDIRYAEIQKDLQYIKALLEELRER
jgi:hypothetical protein